MVRAKQATGGKKRPQNAPSPAQNPSKKRPPPPRAPSLWEKLRFSRKKAPKLLPEALLVGLVRGLSPLRGGFGARGGFGVRGAALAALREGCEAQMLGLLEEWGLCALHAKRAALRTADIRLVRCLRVKRG
ncbi:PREDICTED: histone H3-like [Calidris pugnax]|uniref:histone H3-like n=1 Tax=Calidris pugnax TaxID=198806 RepID=UPI00071D45F6|nr:PREDICTED: histone H3-like [Calidris pugnax]